MANGDSVIYAVLIAGFTAGLFAHIQFITGYDVSSPEAVLIKPI